MKLIAVISLMFLMGCYVPRKAQRDLTKVQSKYPEMLAAKVQELYPIRERIDSIYFTKYRDSILQITDTITEIDTIRCPEVKSYQQKIIYLRGAIRNIPGPTKYLKDTAGLYLINAEMERLKSEAKVNQSSSSFWMRFGIWILVALVLSLIVHIFRK